MKKFLTLSAVLIAMLMFSQSGMKFEKGTFKTILAKAKKEKKLVFVDAYTTWCGPCKQMANQIFPQKEVGDYYNANFINAKIDMEKGEGIAIRKKYNINAFPTYIFVNGDGDLIHTAVGSYPADKFIQIGKDANDPTKQIAFMKKKFLAGEKDPQFLMNYIEAIRYMDPENASKATDRYFENKKDISFTQQEVFLLLSSVKAYNDIYYQKIENNRAEIIKVFPEANLNNFQKSIKFGSAYQKAYNKTTKELDREIFKKEAAQFFTEKEINNELLKTDIRQAQGKKDYVTMEKLALELYKNPEEFDSNSLNSMAWTFFETIDNKTSLLKALDWAKESVKKDENYANTDTLANLYNKLGDRVNAKIWATKSVEIAKKNGEDATDTQKLLDSL